MEIVSTIALISINETLLVQLVSFLIFLFILNRIMIRPLNSVMEERDFFIENMEKEISDSGKTLEDVQRQIEDQEDAVRASALELSRELEEAGSQEARKILEAAREEMTALRQKTEVEIADRLAEARDRIREESEMLAEAMMEKALGRRIRQ